MSSGYYRAVLIMENNRKRWLKINPNLNESSGIYVLYRVDENGIKYAYVGQAKHILTRLAQHLTQYQHIDLSLKKHKLFDKDKNPYGWNVDFILCNESELDDKERFYIKEFALKGYQLRNKTSGGQDSGKVGINDNKPTKGYREGIKQGYKNAVKEIKILFDKYLTYGISGKPNAIKERKLKEFIDILSNHE